MIFYNKWKSIPIYVKITRSASVDITDKIGPVKTDIVYNANPVLDYLSPYLGSV